MSQAIDWDEAYRSGRYQQFWDLSHAGPELAGYLAARPSGAGRVALDLGCGSGRDAVLLAAAGYRTYGVDISQRALEIAAERAAQEGVDVCWRHGNVLALPFDDRSFDLVTDRGCFHHLAHEQRRTYVGEVARVMRPGAELLLRGCRTQRFPFVPVSDDEVVRWFLDPLFHRGPVIPVTLVTDAGPLDGNVCVLRRR